jgi:hypothetical protein
VLVNCVNRVITGSLEEETVEEVRALYDTNADQAEPLWPTQGELPVKIDKTLLEPDAPDDEYIDRPN